MDHNTVCINVDTQKNCGELKHIWRYIGYDECNYTYIPEGMEQLKKFGSLEDAPYFVRTHFMFCTGNCHGSYKFGSTNIYTEDENGNPVYHYEIYDMILDGILENHCKPFVELGFMPFDLVDFNYLPPVKYEWSRYGQYQGGGWQCPPKDYDKWHGFIVNLMEHLVSKYGKEEVESWYFELWNEPDINYWKGSTPEYCKLFDYTEDAVHSVLPDVRLAGPATTGILGEGDSKRFFEFFLNHCKEGANFCSGKKGTRLDYITFHVKGGGFTFDTNAKEESPSVMSLVNQVKNGLDCVKKYGYEDLEIVLSEADPDGLAAGCVFDNANLSFRYTESYATYVASAYHKIALVAEEYGMDVKPLAWAFLFPGERCFEGTRTFSTQGIDKAVFNMFRIFSRLGDETLAMESTGSFDVSAMPRLTGAAANVDCTEVSGFAVKKGEKVQVLVYSHHDDKTKTDLKDVVLLLKGCSTDSPVCCYRIDAEHSNAYAEWIRQGKPWYPTLEQYTRIKEREGLETIDVERSDKENSLELKFKLPAHSVSLFEIG